MRRLRAPFLSASELGAKRGVPPPPWGWVGGSAHAGHPTRARGWVGGSQAPGKDVES
jgi:hypothetical protein